MSHLFSRRTVLGMTLSAGVVATSRRAFAQEQAIPAPDALSTFAARSTLFL